MYIYVHSKKSQEKRNILLIKSRFQAERDKIAQVDLSLIIPGNFRWFDYCSPEIYRTYTHL